MTTRQVDETHATAPTRDEAQRLLGLYLRDHDAAGTSGSRLVHRCRQANRGTAFEPGLSALEEAVGRDRQALASILQQLHVPPSRVKHALMWFAATAGALKLNGHLVTYSPLSRVFELEALFAAVNAKLCLWNTLLDLSTTDTRLDTGAIANLQLSARAQLEAIAAMHRDATVRAFVPEDVPLS